MPRWIEVRPCALAAALMFAPALCVHAQETASQKQILSYKPTQSGVDYEIPSEEDVPKCKVEVETTRNGSGYVMYGPQGQLLRRFMDTNSDRKVDEFRYYKHGMEVYRDIDTNGNDDVDQCRWFNLGGTRWGIDQNEDGRIDSWKIISAEEASREAVLALATKDEQRLLAVMVNADDIKQLGITGDAATKLAANAQEAGARMNAVLSKTKLITPQTKWVRFDCSMLMPNLIPADSGKSRNDLLVYENVMAFIETGGQTGYVQIGEMVKVGDVWKLTQTPQPLEGERLEIAEGGVLFGSAVAATVAGGEGLSQRMKELLDQLRDLDAKAPHGEPNPQALSQYNVARAALLSQIAEESSTPDEKLMWQRQRLEGIAAATQMDSYPNGLDELKRAEQQLRGSGGDVNMLAFAIFQRLLAEYNLQLAKAAPAERAKVQENWLKSLESYVREFPKTEDAAEALLHLAITNEYNGEVDKAKAWYQRLTTGYPQTPPAARATGALRRLDLEKKPLRLTGAGLNGGTIDAAAYRGKVLAVVFWATWCQPCTEELPQMKQLYDTYRKDGFEILGVNLDSPGAPIQQYIKNFSIPWHHIHEEGALESRPAVEYGVISLPTMFLVDRQGMVVSPSATVDDLKKQVPELLKK